MKRYEIHYPNPSDVMIEELIVDVWDDLEENGFDLWYPTEVYIDEDAQKIIFIQDDEEIEYQKRRAKFKVIDGGKK